MDKRIGRGSGEGGVALHACGEAVSDVGVTETGNYRKQLPLARH